ncbi:SGNH/GDSL hydrolase family protein [Curvibacter sp. APW13]|uniref:SGNH/GDSL hydrolase family protein n=1 Tax=Curvibacter sp. APW13 TaxID=3077236 RepID=UPI0028DDD1CD|nr:SGNH/GDSL hydrolase family protein [Curvibacter sp. APW13]MDT8991523.1 SGNH/GDSL hydrolase family protein [Curvibacter sp. APW13]
MAGGAGWAKWAVWLLAWWACNALAQTPAASGTAYVLGDSIAYGLQLDGFADKLKARTGLDVHINYDGARSITTPGNQSKRSGLQAVDDDKALLAQAKVVIVILGMNQMEASFADAQKQLMERLKAAAPKARYYWVDIGATIAPQAASWSERNRTIYANASVLGYEVVSRYKAIFGPQADPLHIEGGKNFADWPTEAGYGGPGNVHGFYGELGQALIAAVVAGQGPSEACKRKYGQNAYVLGDSIAYGLQLDGFADKLKAQLGGDVFINHDVGRSITQPGVVQRKSALQGLLEDRERVAKAHVVVLVLGTNQTEQSFEEAQAELLQQLRAVAPRARLFWVDIGATIATQAAGWSARNRVLYANAQPLNYTMVSRYKAIFGPQADPLNIKPGENFPGWVTEDGYGAPGNVHGMAAPLAQALLEALPHPFANLPPRACPN